MSYSSSPNQTVIIKVYKKGIEDERYWKKEEQHMQGEQHIFNNLFTSVMEQLHHSDGKGEHVYFLLLKGIGC